MFWTYLFCSLLLLKLDVIIAEDINTTPSTPETIVDTTSRTVTSTFTNDNIYSSDDTSNTREQTTPRVDSSSSILDEDTTSVISNVPSSSTASSESGTSQNSDFDKTTASTNTDKTTKLPSSTNDDASSSPLSSESTNDASQSTTTTPPTTIVATTPYHVKDRTSFTWRANNMNENPIVFTVEEGYFISVTVSDVKMSNGNYLLIAGGDSYSDDATDGRVFANTVTGPLSYLFKTSKVYAFCENTVEDGDNPVTYDFTVLFEQVGELTTTTVVTTTTPITIPPTKPEESMYITVKVSGKSLSEYNDTNVRQVFQECVALMAINYCKDNGIILTRNITSDYVILREIVQCPYKWQNTNNCVKITFSLPIFYEGSSASYKLNTNELRMMWVRWEELDEQCFYNNGFSVYEEPDIDRAIVWWAVGISLTTIFFIILLWFLRMFGTRVRRAIKKKYNGGTSDTESILTRDSINSLGPHYLQETPKLFEN